MGQCGPAGGLHPNHAYAGNARRKGSITAVRQENVAIPRRIFTAWAASRFQACLLMTDSHQDGVIGFFDTHQINEDEILAKLAARDAMT